MALTKISRGLLNTGVSDSSDATAITIDSSERIGIGTSSPAVAFHMTGNGFKARFDRTGSAGSVIEYANGGNVVGNLGVQSGGFGLGGGFRDPDLFITTGGAVGIGTTSPGDPLVVSDSGASSITARLINTNADANPANLRLQKLSTSPADNDYIGMINVSGENDASEETIFQSIDFIATDVSDGTEDGNIVFRTRGAGTLAERMKIVSDGQLHFNSGFGSAGKAYGVRAWANINQTTDGIRDSGNVSTIGDEGTGHYTINFSSAMPDTNYAVLGTASNENNGVAIDGSPPSTYTTSAVEVRIFDASNIYQELTNGILNIAVIR